MQLAIASGKGGTGKTTVAANLARALSHKRGGVQLFDCDVEEPNDHLYFRPQGSKVEPVDIALPAIDAGLCDLCGKCAEFCAYHALAVLKEKVMVFSDLCHGCGGCSMVCPKEAISEVGYAIGEVHDARVDGLELVWGLLSIGKPMSSPIIKQVKKKVRDGADVIVDSPPGTACPVIAAVHGVDACLLVTEPTPFGLHDLRIMVEVLRIMKIPFGIVLNRDGIGNDGVENYCAEEKIPIIMRIPRDRRIAELGSRGKLLVDEEPAWLKKFEALWDDIQSKVVNK